MSRSNKSAEPEDKQEERRQISKMHTERSLKRLKSFQKSLRTRADMLRKKKKEK